MVCHDVGLDSEVILITQQTELVGVGILGNGIKIGI